MRRRSEVFRISSSWKSARLASLFCSWHVTTRKNMTAQIEKLWKEFRPTDLSRKHRHRCQNHWWSRKQKRIRLSAFSRRTRQSSVLLLNRIVMTKWRWCSQRNIHAEQVKLFFVLRQSPQFRERKSDRTIETFYDDFLRNISAYGSKETPAEHVER